MATTRRWTRAAVYADLLGRIAVWLEDLGADDVDFQVYATRGERRERKRLRRLRAYLTLRMRRECVAAE